MSSKLCLCVNFQSLLLTVPRPLLHQTPVVVETHSSHVRQVAVSLATKCVILSTNVMMPPMKLAAVSCIHVFGSVNKSSM